MIKKCKESVDNGGAFGALMTNLSKTFDCLHHELLIAKLYAYGFDKKWEKLIQQYLSNKNQRVKVGNTCSSWKEIFYGIPQGAILGLLIFNIFFSISSSKSFEDNKSNLFNNASARIAPYICLQKRKAVMKAYVIFQFGYCSLVWMFCSRGFVNSLHERALGMSYGNR